MGVFLVIYFFFFYVAMFFALSDESSIEKACNAMVPNPIYEGPLYETIDPEFKSLTTLPPAPPTMVTTWLSYWLQ